MMTSNPLFRSARNSGVYKTTSVLRDYPATTGRQNIRTYKPDAEENRLWLIINTPQMQERHIGHDEIAADLDQRKAQSDTYRVAANPLKDMVG